STRHIRAGGVPIDDMMVTNDAGAMTADAFQDLPVHVIEPAGMWPLPRLAELWAYRELVYFLVWREVKVRYKQTALGVAWAVIQPFFTMIVFSVFFGKFGKMPSDGLPYPIFAYA